MALADDPPDLDLIAASLRADAADLGAFTETLATKLEETMGDSVDVKRVRQGFRGPKQVREITVDAGGSRLLLRRDGSRVETLCAHVSGGITLKSEAVGVDEWIGTLTEIIAAQARQSATTRQALERLLLDR